MNTQIQRPPPYELFFAQLETDLPPNSLEAIQTAYIFSKYGHDKQLRDDGTRYFDHPKAVAWIYFNDLCGRDPRVIIDALLHDLREDTYLLSLSRLSLNFGREIALDIRALTKLPRKKETPEAYLDRVIDRAPWTVLVKLCDRLHNLQTLHACSEEKRLRTIKETRELHIPRLLPALRACGGLWCKHAGQVEFQFDQTLAQYDT